MKCEVKPKRLSTPLRNSKMEPDSQDNLVNQSFMVDVTQFLIKLEIRAYNARLVDLTSLIQTIRDCPESDFTKKAAKALVQSILVRTIARGPPDWSNADGQHPPI